MRKIFDLIEQVGPLGSTVLILGETGTGKELVAQAHPCREQPPQRGRSSPSTAPCSTTRCWKASSSATRKGSFTGAERRKIGRFEQADGGTLLLDEVGDVAPAMQAKLLARPADRRVRAGRGDRVDQGRRADRRGHPQAAGGRGQGRPVPQRPLLPAERDPHRPAAASRAQRRTSRSWRPTSCEKYRSIAATPVTEIDADAMQALLQHAWPGNVRELENAIKSAIAFAEGSVIRRENLPETLSPRLPRKLTGCALDRHRPAASRADRRPDRPGRARVLSCGSSPSTTATSPAAPGTAACRGGASPRSSRNTASSASSSSGGPVVWAGHSATVVGEVRRLRDVPAIACSGARL